MRWRLFWYIFRAYFVTQWQVEVNEQQHQKKQKRATHTRNKNKTRNKKKKDIHIFSYNIQRKYAVEKEKLSNERKGSSTDPKQQTIFSCFLLLTTKIYYKYQFHLDSFVSNIKTYNKYCSELWRLKWYLF